MFFEVPATSWELHTVEDLFWRLVGSTSRAEVGRGRRSRKELLWTDCNPTFSVYEGENKIRESENNKMVRVGTDIKDHLVPSPLPLAGMPPRLPRASSGLRELVEVLWEHCEVTLDNLRWIMVTGSFQGLEEWKCHSCLQGRNKGKPRELQTTQPHLIPWQGDGAASPGNHFQTYEELKNHQY